MSEFERKPEPKQAQQADAKANAKRPASDPVVVRGGGGDPRAGMYRPAAQAQQAQAQAQQAPGPAEPAKTGHLELPSLVGPTQALTPEQTAEVTSDLQAEVDHQNIQPGSRPGYFLTPDVRKLAEDKTANRITIASGRYGDACVKVEFKQLLKKQDESTSVIASLVLGCVFGNIGAALGGAIGALQSVQGITKAIENIGGRVSSAAIKSAAKAVSEKEVESVIGTAVDVAKDQTKDAVKSGDKGAERVQEKALGFVDQLVQYGTQMFDMMGEKLIFQLDDGQLLALHQAMGPEQQSMPRYVQAIEERLKLFMSSQASSIGRTETVREGKTLATPVVRETRVAWFATRAGERRLAYMHRDFDGVIVDHEAGDFAQRAAHDDPDRSAVLASWSGANGRGATSYADEQVVGGKTYTIESLTKDDMFAGIVEPELVEPALKRHEETWRYAPRTHLVSDAALHLLETWG